MLPWMEMPQSNAPCKFWGYGIEDKARYVMHGGRQPQVTYSSYYPIIFMLWRSLLAMVLVSLRVLILAMSKC